MPGYRVVLTTFVCIFFFNFSLDASPFELNFKAEAHQNNKKIEEVVQKPLLLERVTFESDITFDTDEFTYLTDLREGTTITANDFKRAIFYLSKKNRFEMVHVHIVPCERGVHLHMRLVGLWLFAKLKIHGLLFGKESYRHYYLMEPGDPFDETKHQHSVEKIIQAFKNEGFFAGNITNSCEYDHATKTITVHITLKPGGKFVIRDVQVNLEDAMDDREQEDVFFASAMHKDFVRALKHAVYKKELINKEVRSLERQLARKGFLHVAINLEEKIVHAKQCVDLHFSIRVHNKRAFVFWGNYFLSHEQLLDTILMFGRSTWLLPASILSEEIVRTYHEKGFWWVQVEAKEEDARYFFVIKEGSRVTVDKVTLKNAYHFDKRSIKRFFVPLTKHTYYDVALLQESINALTNAYLSDGFWDIKVLKQEFIPLEKKDAFELVLTLDEGPQSFITEVCIEPLSDLLDKGPFAKFQKKGSPIPFSAHHLQEQKRWLVEYLQKKGYLYANVKQELERNGSEVRIRWRIDFAHDKVIFGKTVIVGARALPFDHVRRELRYKQGDVWNKDLLKQSFLKLKELEVFEAIHLYPHDVATPEHEKALILKLHPDDPFEVRVRAGLAMQHVTKHVSIAGVTYRAGGSFLVKNPGNVGDQLRLDADFTRVHREVMAQYRRPWLLDTPLKTVYMGYSNKYDQPAFVGSKKNLYEITQQGFLFGLSRKWRHVDAGINTGVEWEKTVIQDDSQFFVQEVARALNFTADLVDKNIPYFQMEPTLIIDYLDNNLRPTKGSFTLATLKGMFPIQGRRSTSHFVRLLVEQSVFIPIKSVVLALRLRLGHIFFKKFSSIMPTERFYLGGANSLRGYENDLTPPLGLFIDEKECKQLVPQGGKSMVNANMELRFGLFKRLGGVVFQDFGALSCSNFADFNAHDVLAATGFGLRYDTPLGPLRFDIGWKWDRCDPTIRPFAWFLTFGHAF